MSEAYPAPPISVQPGLDSIAVKRNMTTDAVFYRQLALLTARIQTSEWADVEKVMLELSQDVCKILNADRMTFYIKSADNTAIVSKVKTGLGSSKDFKLPIGPQSVAGYVALSGQMVNIPDVYEDAALRNIHPALQFLKEVDRRTGYRTKQMLAAPVVNGRALAGVLQIINNKGDRAFSHFETDGLLEICKSISSVMQRSKESPGAKPASEIHAKQSSKYEALVSLGILQDSQLAECLKEARQTDQSPEDLLIDRYGVTSVQIGQSLSGFFRVPYEPYAEGRLRIEALHGDMRREFAISESWIPMEEGPEGLVVMCLDPEAVRGSRVVPQVFSRISKFSYRVTTGVDFRRTLDQLFSPQADAGTIDQLLADMDGGPSEDGPNDDSLESAAADNELVKFVNKVIVDAYHQKASDIHIEPMPGKFKTGIRFRIDGILSPYIEVPSNFRQAMVTRLKIMCDLDISERRKPQDGKIKFKKYGPLDIELRVATIPSAGGVEDVVMRILAAGEPIPLEKLGLTSHNKERVIKTIEKPYGLFYVCGPTGSGKTTTLHSILKHLNTPDTKIWTAEDPVEITQKGLRQVQINKKAGIDFALVMRAFLRADPDIIMVGESRDKETVSMGVEASLTGHLVFSTLHTNSAPESITRLLDMGMDPFNFADALLGILAQRLARKLCDCKESYTPDASEVRLFVSEYANELRHSKAWKTDPDGEAKKLLEGWIATYGESGQLKLYRHVGCDKCGKTGYKGRVGLHELLIADDDVKKLVQERARVAEIFTAAIEGGMRTLKMDGMEKVMMGMTDLKMVRQVCIK